MIYISDSDLISRLFKVIYSLDLFNSYIGIFLKMYLLIKLFRKFLIIYVSDLDFFILKVNGE